MQDYIKSYTVYVCTSCYMQWYAHDNNILYILRLCFHYATVVSRRNIYETCSSDQQGSPLC